MQDQGQEAGGSAMWENRFKKLQDMWLTQAEHKSSRKSAGAEGLSMAEAVARINSLEAELKETRSREALAKEELEKAIKKHEEELAYNEKLLGGVNWQAKIERLEADLKESRINEEQARKELKDSTKRYDEKILYKEKQLRIVSGNLTETQAKISSLELNLDKAKRSEAKIRKELELANENHRAAILERDNQLEELQGGKDLSTPTIDEEILATKKLRIKEENMEILTSEFQHCMEQISGNLAQFNEQLASAKAGDVLTTLTQPPPMFRNTQTKQDEAQPFTDWLPEPIPMDKESQY